MKRVRYNKQKVKKEKKMKNDKAFEEWCDPNGIYCFKCLMSWRASGEYHTEKAIKRVIEIIDRMMKAHRGVKLYLPALDLVDEIKKAFPEVKDE